MKQYGKAEFNPPETKERAPITEARSSVSQTGLEASECEAGITTKSEVKQAAKPTRRVLRDDERLQPIGSPRVIIDRLPWETRVWIDRAVWSLPNADKIFLGKGSRSAERYAEGLFNTLAEQADARVRYRLGRRARNAAGREVARLLNRGESER